MSSPTGTSMAQETAGAPSKARGAVGKWLVGLLWLHAGILVNIGMGFLSEHAVFFLIVPFVLGAGLLISASARLRATDQKTLVYIRYVAGGTLLWFCMSLTVPAFIGVMQLIDGAWPHHYNANAINISLLLFAVAFPTLLLLRWYARPVTAFLDQPRQALLLVLCVGAAVGLPYAATFGGGLPHPLLRLGYFGLCVAGYLGCGMAWVILPGLATRVFPSLVRLTTIIALLYGMTSVFLSTTRRHTDYGYELEGFVLVSALVVAYGSLMLALARGRPGVGDKVERVEGKNEQGDG